MSRPFPLPEGKGTSHLPRGRESLRPGHGQDLGHAHSCFLEKPLTPWEQAALRSGKVPAESASPERGVMASFARGSSPSGEAFRELLKGCAGLETTEMALCLPGRVLQYFDLNLLAYSSHCTNGKTKAP